MWWKAIPIVDGGYGRRGRTGRSLPGAVTPPTPIPRSGSGSPWTIVVLAALTAAATGPGQTIGVSVFIDHLVGDLDLSRTAVSGAYLVGTLAGSATLPAVGRWVDRAGVRRAMTAIGLAFALALVNMAGVQGLIWLTIGFTGIRMLGQGALSLTSTVAVSVSFDRNRGVALAVMMTASSALMALVPVGLDVVISAWGWRSAFVVAALAVTVVVVPIARLGMPDTGRRPAVGEVTPGSVTSAVAVRTRAFWTLAAVTATTSMLVTALNFHQVSLLGEGRPVQHRRRRHVPAPGAGLDGDRPGHGGGRRPGGDEAPAGGGHGASGRRPPARLGRRPRRRGSSCTPCPWALRPGPCGSCRARCCPPGSATAHLGAIQGTMAFVGVGASAIGPLLLAAARSGIDGYGPAVLALGAIPLAVGLAATRLRAPVLTDAAPL